MKTKVASSLAAHGIYIRKSGHDFTNDKIRVREGEGWWLL